MAKVLGSLALIVPQAPHWSKEWAYAGFSFVAIFAGYSHIMVTHDKGLIIMSVVVLGVVLLSRSAYYKLRATQTV